ncbi:cell fate (sporulation/competence/biofilm development) regulator YlbF (YheA/YmcA/DUF963 family) [Pullulanibacillus pueri]|uniref:UPF0342 protein GCM10007096_39460 n=1 Tax=Pullulanibacillus pueri TaxID=1437324 RepID=A0A8J3A0L2_9BACL|nr:YlbF family regulator [Pullulanibacillus pueri]MBM7683410.1 cell fate (sporulation/competence/biofilm development) regulator YlbF (YheA/YmcA/DUF963 family) [Pullulanibacillus pueri]GGH88045.1 UPF0342 protein YheA [Pullulanibacillus pueri]
MANLYDVAYDLEKAIRESNEYNVLKKAHEEIEKDESAKQLFANFRQLQMTLQQKQMQGEQLTEEEANQANQQFQLVQQHPLISTLMNAEQHMSNLFNDMNKIIAKPLDELYGQEG